MSGMATRRGVLAGALALLPGAAGAQIASLAPDGPALRWPGLPGQVTLSAGPARTLAMQTVAGTTTTAVALTDSAPASQIELLIIAGHDGKAPRILAIEVLQWQGPEGRLNSRPVVDIEKQTLILDRTSAMRKTPTLWQREAWRDFLMWDGTMLVDKPVRAAMGGTHQAILGLVRSRTLTWLATPRQALTAGNLVELGVDARSFSLH